MRFPKETVAAIHNAAPGSIIIRWPLGQAAPEKDRRYWLQTEEDTEAADRRAKNHREYSPPTHAEVMARMHRENYGKWPEGFKLKRVRRARRKPNAIFVVLAAEPLKVGWEATVAIYENPDPRHSLRIKAIVPAGPHPIHGHYQKVETEPDQIVVPQTRREREDEEEALRVESAASADRKEVARLKRRVAQQKAAGKPSGRTEQALNRAEKRVGKNSAAQVV